MVSSPDMIAAYSRSAWAAQSRTRICGRGAVPDGAPRRQRADVALADLVAAAGLPGREDALAHPGVGGLVVHPEDLGGLA